MDSPAGKPLPATGASPVAVRYLDDFTVGERFVSRGATLSEAQILDFAWQWDPQPFHLDAEAAAGWGFEGLIASGFHTLLVGFRLFQQENVWNAASVGSPGMDELRWLKPVRPGDTIHAEVEVVEVRPSRSRPDRGSARLRYEMINQRGETVMTVVAIHLLRRRPGAG
ncbi:Acyl dehydratase [Tistlia consotensis]|uniref:Acyl dehydratase n=1 Tax=Tistlia consotensis USBA 355 TaxID=560819 RepID=A0A1Y6BWI5_9PROT|nr:MaoC family dehydratase [Tistlia consotensis]SMF32507.1 Acyl dehydratase [Tistlia consotensis USBA 355]SNR68575.1 Acyl dehydratase [Tistlia consotensis]